MKSKILNFLLVLTSLIGYLEWGEKQKLFLFQAEYEILSKLFKDPFSVLHPFTIIPLAGQSLLLSTLFQKIPNKAITYISIAGIGLLFGLMFIVGLISLKFKILFSTLPFITMAIITIRFHKKLKN